MWMRRNKNMDVWYQQNPDTDRSDRIITYKVRGIVEETQDRV